MGLPNMIVNTALKICVVGVIALSMTYNDVQAKDVYTFGVVPQQSAQRLAALWTPILKELSQQSGVALRFATAKSIPEFEKRLAAGIYDFAYVNPYHFTVFNKAPGYKAVAKRKNQNISGIIVVRKDSPITTLDQLRNAKLAFPSPAAFAASILTRSKLKGDNIAFKSTYVVSHDSVYLGVSKGIFVAGGGVKRTFNNTKPEVHESLRILWTTPAYTPHAFVSHPRLDANIVERVQKALVGLKDSENGGALLASIKIKHGLVIAQDKDWDDVRSLNIDLLEDLSKP